MARTLWMRWVGGLLIVGALASVSASDAAIEIDPASCSSFRDVIRTSAVEPRSVLRLRRGEPLTVVAIGSSSTEGVGASGTEKNYPAWVQRFLRQLYPDRPIIVHNRGVGGQTAGQMLARFDTDVWPLAPHLVLWQTGTIEAMRQTAQETLLKNLREGFDRMRRRGIEVILIDPQYSAYMETRVPNYGRYVEVMRTFARDAGIPLVDRYAAMRQWNATTASADGLLAPDHLHLNDAGYLCLGMAVANFIACGNQADCPQQRTAEEVKRR